jgi:hypothetical protein
MILLAAIFVLSTSIAGVQGQPPTAQVDISCTPSDISLDVYPGATDISGDTICTISNPTSHDEKIELEATHDGYDVSVDFVGGNIIVVPANSDVDVTVSITANEEEVYNSHVLQISATVIESNGAPPPNTVEESVNVMLNFNAYDNYSIIPQNPAVFVIDDTGLLPNQYGLASFSNYGNYNSKLIANTTVLEADLSAENLILSTPQVAINIPVNESTNFTFLVGFNTSIGEPDISSWEVLDNGSKVLYINSTILVESEKVNSGESYCYQCDQTVNVQLEIYHIEGIANSDVVEEPIDDDTVPGFLVMSCIVSVTIAALISNRRN